ncbi:MAG: sigma-54 dependent transcriptional regulator, partial [Planctomycetota bacterium]|nr:sigma-54 dependent transcriptional regulator [Planctomycetota bacterium]
MDPADKSVLVVDDEPAMQALLTDAVEASGWTAFTASNAAEALSSLEDRVPDAVITDLRMPGGMDGFQLFQTIRRLHADLPVVIMSAYGSIETAVESIKCGAFDYLPKPFKIERVVHLLDSLQTVKELNRRASTESAQEIIGRSPTMLGVKDFVERAANFDSTVFMQGDSGTGKEFVARSIHRLSSRHDEPFVTLSCSAMDPNIIERALWGQSDTAPGATESYRGLMERVGSGTLFLDEITEIPGHLQADLLQVIENGEFFPIGSDIPVKLSARLMVATTCDLTQALQNGQFRKDLFYRLHVLPIHLPPLKARTEDIPLLFEHFVSHLTDRGIEPKTLTPDALAKLIAYHWPGNVSELENCVERALVMAPGQEIRAEDLPDEVTRSATPSSPKEPIVGCRLKDYEHAAVLNALRVSGGNKRQASRILEISIATLYKKLKDYNI